MGTIIMSILQKKQVWKLSSLHKATQLLSGKEEIQT